MSAIQKMVDHFGGQTKTAKALGVSQAAVSYWLSGVHTISAEHAFKAEEITGGLVTAKELCARELHRACTPPKAKAKEGTQ